MAKFEIEIKKSNVKLEEIFNVGSFREVGIYDNNGLIIYFDGVVTQQLNNFKNSLKEVVITDDKIEDKNTGKDIVSMTENGFVKWL